MDKKQIAETEMSGGTRGNRSRLNEQKKDILVNSLGMLALIGVTALIYLKTNQPLIFVIGGLVMVAAVMAAFMR